MSTAVIETDLAARRTGTGSATLALSASGIGVRPYKTDPAEFPRAFAWLADNPPRPTKRTRRPADPKRMPLDRWLDAHRHDEFLTAEAEAALAERARDGDRAARDALVLANIRLACWTASKRNRRQWYRERRQDALVGLVKAADKYCHADPLPRERFTTWAENAATWRMSHARRDADREPASNLEPEQAEPEQAEPEQAEPEQADRAPASYPAPPPHGRIPTDQVLTRCGFCADSGYPVSLHGRTTLAYARHETDQVVSPGKKARPRPATDFRCVFCTDQIGRPVCRRPAAAVWVPFGRRSLDETQRRSSWDVGDHLRVAAEDRAAAAEARADERIQTAETATAAHWAIAEARADRAAARWDGVQDRLTPMERDVAWRIYTDPDATAATVAAELGYTRTQVYNACERARRKAREGA